MARFNWAYINCGVLGSSAGPTGSVQFLSSGNDSTGSVNFMFYTGAIGGYAANTLTLTGTVHIGGALYASEYHVDKVTEASGSTYFGNSNTDVHIRTGSMTVALSSSTPILDVSTTTERVTVRGFAGRYTPVTASLFTSSNSHYLLGVQAAANLEMRIHSAVTALSGAIVVVKDEVSSRVGLITVSASGAETIDGAAFYQLSGSHPAISLYSNGANWFVY